MDNQKIIAAVLAGHSPKWVHNAAHTNDIEALRSICLDHAAWWNNTAWPLLVELIGSEEKALEQFQHLQKERGKS